MQKATSEKPLDSYSGYIGYGEVSLTSPIIIDTIDRSLQAVAVDLTLVN